MGNSKKRIGLIILGIIIFSTISLTNQVNRTQAVDPFFTLVFKTYGGGFAPDYGNFLRQHCARLRIDIDVFVLSWSDFFRDVFVFKDFDICYFSFEEENLADPDFTGVYDENGSLNLFGYHTSMDWDEDKGTGLNEWYMKEGTLILSPDSEERVQHYWEWQQYLMDKILPLAPTYSPLEYLAFWSNLVGYNFINGLKQSWGKMSWSGSHVGQISDDEIVICSNPWINLNPLVIRDSASLEITNLIFDSLFMIDSNQVLWPHLAQNYTFLNDTHLRINCRKGIKWQEQQNSMVTNEYFDANDVYFSLFCWRYLSLDSNDYSWIKDIHKVNDTCIDLYIDGDSKTIQNEPYTPILSKLAKTPILPEHLLNQTQCEDEVTPDIDHISWERFSTEPIGTSLFKLNNYTKEVETNLTIYQNCWWLNSSIVDDSLLNWTTRFGVFSDPINQLRIRILPDLQTQVLEFEFGKLDLIDITWHPKKIDDFIADSDFTVQSDTTYRLDFYGFNLQSTILGSRETAPLDSSLSIGLALRKAISYAIDRVEINQVIHRNEYVICDYPIYPKLGNWCNPNIIRYYHDIDKARYYITIAGLDDHECPPSGNSLGGWQKFGIAFTSIVVPFSIGIIVIVRKRRISKLGKETILIIARKLEDKKDLLK